MARTTKGPTRATAERTEFQGECMDSPDVRSSAKASGYISAWATDSRDPTFELSASKVVACLAGRWQVSGGVGNRHESGYPPRAQDHRVRCLRTGSSCLQQRGGVCEPQCSGSGDPTVQRRSRRYSASSVPPSAQRLPSRAATSTQELLRRV